MADAECHRFYALSKRVPKDVKRFCGICRQHGVMLETRGHTCQYKDCTCTKCELVRTRRHIMSQQIRLRRAQDKRFQRTSEPKEADVVPLKQFKAAEAAGAPSAEQRLLDARSMCYFCQKCKNHNVLVWKKQHKRQCPFNECACERCELIETRRRLDQHMKSRRADLAKQLAHDLQQQQQQQQQEDEHEQQQKQEQGASRRDGDSLTGDDRSTPASLSASASPKSLRLGSLTPEQAQPSLRAAGLAEEAAPRVHYVPVYIAVNELGRVAGAPDQLLLGRLLSEFNAVRGLAPDASAMLAPTSTTSAGLRQHALHRRNATSSAQHLNALQHGLSHNVNNDLSSLNNNVNNLSSLNTTGNNNLSSLHHTATNLGSLNNAGNNNLSSLNNNTNNLSSLNNNANNLSSLNHNTNNLSSLNNTMNNLSTLNTTMNTLSTTMNSLSTLNDLNTTMNNLNTLNNNLNNHPANSTACTSGTTALLTSATSGGSPPTAADLSLLLARGLNGLAGNLNTIDLDGIADMNKIGLRDVNNLQLEGVSEQSTVNHMNKVGVDHMNNVGVDHMNNVGMDVMSNMHIHTVPGVSMDNVNMDNININVPKLASIGVDSVNGVSNLSELNHLSQLRVDGLDGMNNVFLSSSPPALHRLAHLAQPAACSVPSLRELERILCLKHEQHQSV